MGKAIATHPQEAVSNPPPYAWRTKRRAALQHATPVEDYGTFISQYKKNP